MPSDLYVSLSGQMVAQTRLSTIANNVANMRTAGFRAETVNFDTVLSDFRRDAVAFAAVGEMHIDRAAGPIEATGNPLDLAIDGHGWFAIETPAGRAYTRDGRMTMTEAGDLVTLTGYALLDDGGAPIALERGSGPVAIGVDGTISQGGRGVGVIGLFDLPDDAKLARYGDSAVLTDIPAEPMEDRVLNGVRQGFLEGSNVNAIMALTELIEVQRAFEHSNSATRDRQETLQKAVRTLGAR